MTVESISEAKNPRAFFRGISRQLAEQGRQAPRANDVHRDN
ncbi:hypothetical protein [Desulfoscipio sp. XC116]